MVEPVAFLITPFSAKAAGDEWPPMYAAVQDMVLDAAKRAGVAIQRADDIFRSGVVIEQVQQAIDQADLVIAICTGRNPNVFYELGYAEAAGHQPILVAASTADLPFDIAHKRTQLYGNDVATVPNFAIPLSRALVESLGTRSAHSFGSPNAVDATQRSAAKAELERDRDDLRQIGRNIEEVMKFSQQGMPATNYHAARNLLGQSIIGLGERLPNTALLAGSNGPEQAAHRVGMARAEIEQALQVVGTAIANFNSAG